MTDPHPSLFDALGASAPEERPPEPESGDPSPEFSTPFALRVLGPVDLVSADGEPIPVPRGKPMAVLAFLALTPEGVVRDRLAELLWGDRPLTKGRHSVRQALSRLSKELGADVFASVEPVRLVPGIVRTDLEAFRDAVSSGDVDSALELWNGDPFAGLERVDEREWGRWVDDLTRSARRVLVSALEEVASAAVSSGDLDEAVERLKRACSLDPERAETWARLAEVQVDHGRVREARTTLADAWSHLTPAVYESHLSVYERRVSLGPEVARVDESGRIVARERDLAVAAEAWRSSLAGRTGVLVYSGGPGMGKSRVLREVGSPEVTPGATVISLAVGESRRWSVVQDIVLRINALSGADEVLSTSRKPLEWLLEGMGGTSAAAPTEAELADAFLDLLGATCSRAPVLLLLDGAHRCDGPSWTLLRRLVRLRPGVPLLLCMGMDTGAADLEVRTDIDRWVERDWASLRGLRPFTREEIETLVRRRGWPAGRAGEVSGEVLDTTAGHPALVLGFLDAAKQAGRAADDDPSRSGPLALERLPLSDELAQRYEARIQGLPAAAEGVVRSLAKTSRATIPTLAYGLGLEESVVGELVERMLEGGVLKVSDDGAGVTLSHPGIAGLVPQIGDEESRWEPPTPAIPPEEMPQPELWADRRITWVSKRDTFLVRLRTVAVVAAILYLVWAVFLG